MPKLGLAGLAFVATMAAPAPTSAQPAPTETAESKKARLCHEYGEEIRWELDKLIRGMAEFGMPNSYYFEPQRKGRRAEALCLQDPKVYCEQVAKEARQFMVRLLLTTGEFMADRTKPDRHADKSKAACLKEEAKRAKRPKTSRAPKAPETPKKPKAPTFRNKGITSEF